MDQEFDPNSGSAADLSEAVPAKRAWLAWKPIAAMAGAGIAVAAGAVVATLALTHQSARHENLRAYLNGFSAGRRSLLDWDDWDFDDFDDFD